MRPRNLWRSWSDILLELKKARRIAVFSDFDGTLAPIRQRPRNVVLPAAARRAFRELRGKGVVCGILTGRSLRDVRSRARVEGIWYVGSHGASFLSPDNHESHRVNLRQRRRLRRAKMLLQRALRGIKGVWLEEKSGSIAVHYRGANPEATRKARRALDVALRNVPGLQCIAGKKVWEVLPPAAMNKGTALEHILKKEGGPSWRAQFRIVYLGDDVTDESIFRQVRGITVVVGKRPGTAARYFVRTPGEARKFLLRLAEAAP
jgi:trehalose-phosphatase